jgi:hypothetical protein
MISPHRTNPDDQGRLAALSLRERQVLALVARGKSAKGIGLILEISPRTVYLSPCGVDHPQARRGKPSAGGGDRGAGRTSDARPLRRRASSRKGGPPPRSRACGGAVEAHRIVRERED